MYKLENGITFRKFNVVNSLFFSVIRWYLFNVIHGHRPANLDCRIASGNDSRTEWNTSGNYYRAVQSGRSMIEMLGVLAIIAVLSVGGIAGYVTESGIVRNSSFSGSISLPVISV